MQFCYSCSSAALHIGVTAHGQTITVTNNTTWVDDVLPAGAVPGSDGGDGWNWVSSNPTPLSGTMANQSSSAGLHQHYFWGATKTLQINAGEMLYAYVYLDPNNPPNEIMLQWNDGSWEHRAFWGVNMIDYGTTSTPGRRFMGTMPVAGRWVRLEVPATIVGLEGSTVSGIAFSQFGGRATWDNAGRLPLRH